MPLTADQKRYIKKNIQKISPDLIADDLDLPLGEVWRYIKNHWPKEKYEKLIFREKPKENSQTNFVFGEFFQKNLFIFAGLFLLVFAVYVNSLGNRFVSDDTSAVLNNPNIRSASGIFNNGLFGSLQQFLYFLSYKIGGLNPAFFRIFNLIFHLGSTWLVFIILKLLTKRNIAVIAAVLFAVHPILIESVTWISGSPYAIGAFFVLLSFLGYIINAKKYWPIIFFSLALITIDKVMVLPMILFLYELIFGGTNSLKKNWKKLAPFFGLSALWVIISLSKLGGRISSIDSSAYQNQSGGLYNPLVQIPIALGNYFKLIFWPDKLTLYHTEMSFNTGQYIAYLLVFLIFLAAIFWGWKKNKAVFFWLSFFFITLIPTLTPLKIAWIVAERYVYLGSIGIFVVVAMFFDWIYEKSKERNEQYKYAAVAIFAVIILALSVRTIVRNMDWKNEDTLWIATAKISPSGQVIHNNLGDVYARLGNMEKSVEEFKKAIEINPRYADAYHNLANDYQNMGKTDLAVENYQKALEFNPGLWQSHQNLASIYFNLGDFTKALDHIQKALMIDPQNKNLQENLQVIQAKIQ